MFGKPFDYPMGYKSTSTSGTNSNDAVRGPLDMYKRPQVLKRFSVDPSNYDVYFHDMPDCMLPIMSAWLQWSGGVNVHIKYWPPYNPTGPVWSEYPPGPMIVSVIKTTESAPGDINLFFHEDTSSILFNVKKNPILAFTMPYNHILATKETIVSHTDMGALPSDPYYAVIPDFGHAYPSGTYTDVYMSLSDDAAVYHFHAFGWWLSAAALAKSRKARTQIVVSSDEVSPISHPAPELTRLSTSAVLSSPGQTGRARDLIVPGRNPTNNGGDSRTKQKNVNFFG